VRFRLEDAAVRYGSKEALRCGRLELGATEFVAVVGPNGAGKSTLVSMLAGLRDYTGACLLDDLEVRDWPRRGLSRAVAFAPQSVDLQFPFTSREVALMGRAPHARRMFDSPDDIDAADRAMADTDTLHLADRDFRTLSGGEKQRVVLAAAIAQSAPALLLDEPTAHLDPKHQLAAYDLLARQAASGKLVVVATHDLRLAREFCTRVVVLRQGAIVGEGLSPETFSNVFEVDHRRWLGA
jgi:iron complex transport system ATP-binding protein